jgi:hypothetical protein
VAHPGLLRALGLSAEPRSAGDVWRALLDRFPPDDPAREWTAALDIILHAGPLGRRLVTAAGDAPEGERLREVWRRLCDCLAANEPFEGA